MEQFWESSYEKNLWTLQTATDELLSHMKGYDWSFRREITDKKGNFNQEKLCALVDEMLSLWAEDLRDGRYEDVTEPYLAARLDLYRSYLYLAMRCSLCQGSYSDARNGAEEQERTDFAFLLKQAKRLSQDWCVMAGPDGKRRNELYWGYDRYFGFHLYHLFNEFGSSNKGMDWALTPDYARACEQPDHLWTNEGNTRLISIKHLSEGLLTRPSQAEEAEVPEEQVPPEEPYDAGDDLDDYDYDPAEDDDPWLFLGGDDVELQWTELSEEDNREQRLRLLWTDFGCVTEYLSACEDFKKLFSQAAPEVPRNFYADLEEIVDLYLFKREIPPLMDMDRAQDVYGRICDGALRQAKRYGRGIQWKGL